jgi:hypothetical protein
VRGIDNTASLEIVDHLKVAAAGMEEVRALLGAPIHVDSGYRSPALNEAVRGVPGSAHTAGYAVDFICPRFGAPLEIVKIIAASSVKFDQLIQEGTWVHISFDPAMRQEVLTAHFVDGKATYQRGIAES